MTQVTSCLNCNTILKNLPHKRKKTFCDSTCRSNYWQKSKRLEANGFNAEEIVTKLNTVTVQKIPETKITVVKKKIIVVKKSLLIQPVKQEGENSLDFAARKNEWKKQYI